MGYQRPNNNNYRANPYQRQSQNYQRQGQGSFNRDIDFAYSETPDFSGLEPFKRDFYKEHPEVAALSSDEVNNFRKEHKMVLQGRDVPKPLKSFNHAAFGQSIINKFAKDGFESPTPIQMQGWPMALSGRNVVGIAQTGSGKTLAFALPAFVHILAQKKIERGDGPACLILAPTRELACQIHEVIEAYGRELGIRNACLYGGASKGPQIGQLNRSPHVIVATPGRLLDLLKMGKTTLRRVTYLVLDEADRMLDMGFEEPLREILSQIRPDRQLLFWSATWPKSVQRLAHDIQGEDTIKLQIGFENNLSLGLSSSKLISQLLKA